MARQYAELQTHSFAVQLSNIANSVRTLMHQLERHHDVLSIDDTVPQEKFAIGKRSRRDTGPPLTIPPEVRETITDRAERLECGLLSEHLRYQAQRTIQQLGRISLDVPIEEEREKAQPQRGPLWLVATPISSFSNHRYRAQNQGNYGICLTLLDSCQDTHFSDILATAVLNLQPGVDQKWISWRGANLHYRTLYNEREIMVRQYTGDPVNNQELFRLLCRRPSRPPMTSGSDRLPPPDQSVIDSAHIVGGKTTVVSYREQTHSVIGAAYATVLGAGGIVTNFRGVELDHLLYHFEAKRKPSSQESPGLAKMDALFSCGGHDFHEDLVNCLRKT